MNQAIPPADAPKLSLEAGTDPDGQQIGVRGRSQRLGPARGYRVRRRPRTRAGSALYFVLF
jgi:hypothetical protein